LSAGSQVVAQASLVQTNPSHDRLDPVPAHIPAPSQVLVTTVPGTPGSQVWPHGVPLPSKRQWPAPSHWPVVPQASMESLQLSGSTMPAGTSWQLPLSLLQL
jgi:hypothetical protein